MKTRIKQPIREEQLFEVIGKYLENAGLIQRSFQPLEKTAIRKLELAVRSLNLQRQP
ncbi:MAG: hypothetical protein U0519_05205 [Candidatus Gracilibacteria bacterium]